MVANPLKVQVASPCPASWDQMDGDDKVRFCALCRLNVYNLSAMSRHEADDLVRNREGRLCVRFYQRPDGTVLTQDCPRGLAAVQRSTRRAVGALAGLVGGMLALMIGLLLVVSGSRAQAGGKFDIWQVEPFRTVDALLPWSTPTTVMGDCVPPPNPPPEPDEPQLN
jgi:hypothetical protein